MRAPVGRSARRPATSAAGRVPSDMSSDAWNLTTVWTRTSTKPPFVMATVQASTSQVSKAVQRDGVHEPRYTEYWRRLIARCCAGGGLVVDVGANLGWFSLLSASMGCRVLAFEPVPALGGHCRGR